MEVGRLFKVRRRVYIIVVTLFSTCEMSVGGGGGGVVSGSGSLMGCTQQFGPKVTQCLEPYWSVAALFSSNRPAAADRLSVTLAKQLCLQFEIALVCLHTELTQCPSHPNIQYVQSKLGSDWAVEIRNLCVGQSDSSTNEIPRQDISDLDQIMDPTNEQEFPQVTHKGKVADDEDDDDDDDSDVADVNHEEIIVVVPDYDGEFQRDVVVNVRNRVKLKPRHRHRHHPKRLHALDIKVYNIFEQKQTDVLANAAAAANMSVVLTVLTFLLFLEAVVLCWS